MLWNERGGLHRQTDPRLLSGTTRGIWARTLHSVPSKMHPEENKEVPKWKNLCQDLRPGERSFIILTQEFL